jgi:large subunit ribosomal protein L17
MRHRVKKIKFKNGYDANKMLIRKLATNFFLKGKLTTTLAKAKAIKPVIEKLVEKMKVENEANKNYLWRELNNKQLIKLAFSNIGPALSKINGGYVKIIKGDVRISDGSKTAQILWVYPVVLDENKSKLKIKEEKNI